MHVTRSLGVDMLATMRPGADRPRRQTPAILPPPPVLFFGCLLLGWGLGRIRPFEPFALSLAVRLALGSLCFGATIALGGSAVLVMHRSKTPADPWEPTMLFGSYDFSLAVFYNPRPVAVGSIEATSGSVLASSRKTGKRSRPARTKRR